MRALTLVVGVAVSSVLIVSATEARAGCTSPAALPSDTVVPANLPGLVLFPGGALASNVTVTNRLTGETALKTQGVTVGAQLLTVALMKTLDSDADYDVRFDAQCPSAGGDAGPSTNVGPFAFHTTAPSPLPASLVAGFDLDVTLEPGGERIRIAPKLPPELGAFRATTRVDFTAPDATGGAWGNVAPSARYACPVPAGGADGGASDAGVDDYAPPLVERAAPYNVQVTMAGWSSAHGTDIESAHLCARVTCDGKVERLADAACVGVSLAGDAGDAGTSPVLEGKPIPLKPEPGGCAIGAASGASTNVLAAALALVALARRRRGG